MQSDSFKPVGVELSVRGGGASPMMRQPSPFSAVPVDPLAGQAVRDFTGRAGAGRNSKGAPPQGAREVQLSGTQPPVGAAPPPQPVAVAPANGTVAPMAGEGMQIPRRPDAVPQRMAGQPRPFLQRAAPRQDGHDAYVVTLSGMAPDGQIYDVQIPFRATFPSGTAQITPYIERIEGGDQG